MRKTFTINGKRYEVTGKTQRELDDRYFYKRLEVEKLNSQKTVSEWCYEWLERYKKFHITDKNYRNYIGLCEKHILPFIGEIKLGNVTRKQCQSVLNNMKGYSAFYIHKTNFTLKGMFQMAVIEELIDSNPADCLVKPKGNVNKRRSLTDEERQQLLAAIQGKHYENYFKLMLYCGLRPHECAFVQGKDISDKTLHIKGIKTQNADRYVPLPKIIILPDLKDEEYLFYHLTEQKRKRWWESVKRILGNVTYTPYCLRHTYCTDLETAGVPINVAKQLMGHSDISLTSNIYTHTSSLVWEETIAKVERLWESE